MLVSMPMKCRKHNMDFVFADEGSTLHTFKSDHVNPQGTACSGNGYLSSPNDVVPPAEFDEFPSPCAECGQTKVRMKHVKSLPLARGYCPQCEKESRAT